MSTQNIAISKLMPSPVNVRKTPPSKKEDAELLASIRAEGMLQNLIVVPAKKKGNFEVIAGGRRHKALKALVKLKVLKNTEKVPCTIRANTDNASEISLSENINRAALHPADEFDAYNKLKAEGLSIKEIATRFGVTQRHVQQRLKLAGVHPNIITAYRAGKTNLDIVIAFTVEDNQEKQLEVWQSAKGDSWVNEIQIKNALKDHAVDANHKLTRFVTIKAYKAAGGSVTTDLFSDSVYLDQVDLLQAQALEKLSDEADKLNAQGWKWVDIALQHDNKTENRYGKLEKITPETPAEILNRQKAIDARITELEALDDEVWEKDPDYQTEYNELENQQQAIAEEIDQLDHYKAEEIPFAGCMISIEYDGSLNIVDGLVKKEDLKLLKKAQAETTSTSGSTTENGEFNASDDAEYSSNAGEEPQADPNESEPTAEISNALQLELTAQRLIIAKAHLAANKDVARDLLYFNTCIKCLQGPHSYYGSSPLDLRCENTLPSGNDEAIDNSPAAAELKSLHDTLSLEWLNYEDQGEVFSAFCQLESHKKQSLIAYCTAVMLNGQLATDPHQNTALEAAIDMLNIDWPKHWRPTAKNFLGRISKEDQKGIGYPLTSEWPIDGYKGKKRDIAEQLEQVFNGKDDRITGDSRKQALKWMPAGFATVAAD